MIQLRRQLRAEIQAWPMKEPFSISGHVFDAANVLYVEIEEAGVIGRAEAASVYYLGETSASLLATVERVKSVIEQGLTRTELQSLLPPGGARNALDCALWDLESNLVGTSVLQLSGVEKAEPLLTTFTCGADHPSSMANAARSFTGARAIKLKLTGERVDFDRVAAVRDALPNVWLGVDPNQGFTRRFFDAILPMLQSSRVSLIEQPFPRGSDDWLDGLDSPIPIAADESLQHAGDLEAAVGRFDVINIKLDKTGGLTGALAMSKKARDLGFGVMVGNMTGTSLAMAPAFLVGQGAEVVDLDGPAFLTADRESPVRYSCGTIDIPAGIWGDGVARPTAMNSTSSGGARV